MLHWYVIITISVAVVLILLSVVITALSDCKCANNIFGLAPQSVQIVTGILAFLSGCFIGVFMYTGTESSIIRYAMIQDNAIQPLRMI